MPRKFFRRLSSRYRDNHHTGAWYLRPFKAVLHHPVYFSAHRRNIARGVALGLFVGVLPFLGHTPVVIMLALLLRTNLPVAVLSAWIANPLTYGPIFYVEYLIGSYLLRLPADPLTLDMPWVELATRLASAWKPLWLGGLVLATILGGFGYVLVQTAWRLVMVSRYRRRQQRQRLQRNPARAG